MRSSERAGSGQVALEMEGASARAAFRTLCATEGAPMARLNDGIYDRTTLCTHSTRGCEGPRFKFPAALLARLPEPHKANGRQTLRVPYSASVVCS